MSTCQGAPGPHLNCLHGERCDWTPPQPPKVVLVEVDCPDCGNVNRAARRRCRFCRGTGKAYKNLPQDAS